MRQCRIKKKTKEFLKLGPWGGKASQPKSVEPIIHIFVYMKGFAMKDEPFK